MTYLRTKIVTNYLTKSDVGGCRSGGKGSNDTAAAVTMEVALTVAMVMAIVGAAAAAVAVAMAWALVMALVELAA